MKDEGATKNVEYSDEWLRFCIRRTKGQHPNIRTSEQRNNRTTDRSMER